MKSHNLSSHPLYSIWDGMKSRCYIKCATSYPYYGGKGIIVCNEWKNNFVLFYEWAIQNGWIKGMSIDRISNSGNYSPDNCRIIPLKKQNANRDYLKRYTINGQTKILTEWCVEYKIKYERVSRRLQIGAIEKALTIPIKTKNNQKSNG